MELDKDDLEVASKIDPTYVDDKTASFRIRG
jgi:hypothetical protein